MDNRNDRNRKVLRQYLRRNNRGLCMLPNRFNRQQNLNFLKNDLLHIMDDAPYRLRYIFIRDGGTPPHSSLNFRENFDLDWKERGRPVYWLSCSPDLNLNNFLWRNCISEINLVFLIYDITCFKKE